ncbi:MAG TPA: RagB/SusD family nutrient uptake outer membrane protein [Niabella sp.]|nr:RagB/SusD family nutrient uptake outer membrane protein [Niabella sp.]
MKPNRLHHLFYFTFIFLTLISCKKYLEEKSDKSLVVLETLSDLQGLLDNASIMNLKTPGFGQTSDDDYFVSESNYNSFGENDKRAYTWTLDTYGFPNDWAYSYNAIYNSNFCLEQISKIEKTSKNKDAWNNVRGSAYFYRGFYFLNLAWEYAKAYDESTYESDLGVPLRLNSNFNIPSIRANVKETYEQAILDLREAVNLLPDNPQYQMRPSKAATYGTLARAYLSMRKYDSAYKYADLALKIKNDLLDFNSSEVSINTLVPIKPQNPEIIFYTTQSGSYTPKASFFALTDTVLYNLYSEDDLRKTVYFLPNGGYTSFKGWYSGASNVFFSGIATDELYLIRAECNARLERLTEALIDLNALLIKRWKTGTFLPISVSTTQQALIIILQERRKELTMRGLRWIDIKRLNKEGFNISPRREVGGITFNLLSNDPKFALPLPQAIIDITGMQQN